MEWVDPGPAPPNLRRADELNYRDVQSLDRSRTICFCAVSALEVHGPHLPLGSDLHQAVWMARETGRRYAQRHADWTVLEFPPLPIGADELPLAGSVNTPPRVVYRAVLAFGRQLARAGFRYVVLTNAHGGPRHAAALESACRRVSRRHRIAMFTPSIRALHRMVTGQTLDQVEARIGRSLTPEERTGLTHGEHAGTWETSWYLAQRPELVSADYKGLAEDHPPRLAWMERAGERLAAALDRAGRGDAARGAREILGHLAGSFGWLMNARSGYGRGGERVTYSGWPGVASPEVGRVYAELPVEMCLEDVEAVTGGTLDPREVRSIASDPALIQPWFSTAVVGALAALGLLLFWLLV